MGETRPGREAPARRGTHPLPPALHPCLRAKGRQGVHASSPLCGSRGAEQEGGGVCHSWPVLPSLVASPPRAPPPGQCQGPNPRGWPTFAFHVPPPWSRAPSPPRCVPPSWSRASPPPGRVPPSRLQTPPFPFLVTCPLSRLHPLSSVRLPVCEEGSCTQWRPRGGGTASPALHSHVDGGRGGGDVDGKAPIYA